MKNIILIGVWNSLLSRRSWSNTPKRNGAWPSKMGGLSIELRSGLLAGDSNMAFNCRPAADGSSSEIEVTMSDILRVGYAEMSSQKLTGPSKRANWEKLT